MPSLQEIRTAIAKLPHGQPLVVVIAGGTTGIGSYIADALAEVFAQHGAKLRVYIVGRTADRAQTVITRARETSPGSDWRFVQVSDLAYLSQVDSACAEIVRQESEAPLHPGGPRIDLLYMTHSYPILKAPTETSEGLDSLMSTLYYSRVRFILQLLPLLTASSLPAHVVSVYAGTMEDGTTTGQCPLGTPAAEVYGINSVRKHVAFMKCFMFEELARRHRGKLSLIHIYPGLIDGPAFYSADTPTWFKIIWWFMKPLASFYMTAPRDCGQIMAYLATPHYPPEGVAANVEDGAATKSSMGVIGGGSYSLGRFADPPRQDVMFEKARTSDTSTNVWEHTMEVLSRVEPQTSIDS